MYITVNMIFIFTKLGMSFGRIQHNVPDTVDKAKVLLNSSLRNILFSKCHIYY